MKSRFPDLPQHHLQFTSCRVSSEDIQKPSVLYPHRAVNSNYSHEEAEETGEEPLY